MGYIFLPPWSAMAASETKGKPLGGALGKLLKRAESAEVLTFLSLHPFFILLAWNIGEGNGTPLQYSCLENPMDGGAWWAAVHGVTKSQTRLSDFTFTFPFHALEKEMATHSSVLAWRIPGMGEPGGLPSMGSHRVRHEWSDSSSSSGLEHRLCCQAATLDHEGT